MWGLELMANLVQVSNAMGLAHGPPQLVADLGFEVWRSGFAV